MDFFLLITVVLLSSGFLIYLGGGRMISPTGIVGYYVLIYYAFKIVWNRVFSVPNLFDLSWGDFLLPFSLLGLVLVFAGVFSISLNLSYRKYFMFPHRISSGLTSVLTPSRIFIVCYLFLPIGSLLLARARMGVWAWEAPVYFRAFIQSGGMMYLYVTNVFIVQMGLIMVVRKVFLERKWPALWLLLGIPFAALYSLNTGFSSTVLMMAFPAVLYLCFRRGWRIEFLLPVFIPLAAFFAFTHLLYKRNAVDGAQFSMMDAYRTTKENPDWDYGFLNRLDYPEQFVLSSRYTLLDGGGDGGINMLGVFAQPIPRSIWPNKPLTFSSYMTRELQPDNYYAGISANFGGMSELFNAFGLWAVIPGVLFYLLYFYIGAIAYAKACVSDWHYLFYYSVIFQLIAGAVTGAFVNDLAVFNAGISYVLLGVFTGSWTGGKFVQGNTLGNNRRKLSLTSHERQNVPVVSR